MVVRWQTPRQNGTSGRSRKTSLPTVAKVGAPIESEEDWQALLEWLPKMLSALLASEVYGVDTRPPRDQRGIYLFTHRNTHLYVGRTGITAQSRASGRPPITSFRHRFDQHTQRGRPPGAAAFAKRLTLAAAKRRGIEVPSKWWDTRLGDGAEVYGLFCAAKKRIENMECRVVAFDDDIKGVRSSVAEIYVHTQLRTTYNDFSTS
jgi:hypothetical protein